jgi:DUF1680 family protein
MELRLRIPGWCQEAAISVNGESIGAAPLNGGYLALNRNWRAGDRIRMDLAMPIDLIEPNPRVDAIRGCLAIQRGPLVYCLEAQDQGGDVNILDVSIDANGPLQTIWKAGLLGGLMLVEARGARAGSETWTHELYRPVNSTSGRNGNEIRLVALPYYAWGNRGVKGMRVWIPKVE